MIPLKPSDVLRVVSPRKTIQQTNYGQNRFAALARDRSISADRRNRSASVKRRLDIDDGTDQGRDSDIAAHSDNSNQMIIVTDAETVASMTEDMTAALKVVSGIQNCLNSEEISAPLREALGGITQVMGYIGKVAEALVKCAKPANLILPPQSRSYASIAAEGSKKSGNPSANNAKRGRMETERGDGGSNMADLSSFRNRSNTNSQQTSASAHETIYHKKKKAFAKVVSDAEKSTLIFNLNMGKTPIMNPATMQKNALLALTTLAANKEGGSTSTPSRETVETLDDAISMAKNVAFYGKTTKSYRNPKDSNSGSYCTIPVRYDFQDRTQKILVEDVLKDKCDIACTTPYPLILRECIKRAYNSVKEVYPDNGVKILVDADRMLLKIARKPKGSKTWYYKEPVSLPLDVLDTMAKKIPENFHFDISIPRTPVRDDSPSIVEPDGPVA